MVEEDDCEEWRYTCARVGDHLLRPFQCDYCTFLSLRGHLPSCRVPLPGDQEILLTTIRRENLDGFWSREPATVKSHLAGIKQLLSDGTTMKVMLLPIPTPVPFGETMGMKVALGLLRKSLRPGIDGAMKFSTVRKQREVFTGISNAFGGAREDELVFARDKSRLVATSSETYNSWFVEFVLGLQVRMGIETKQDQVISRALVGELITSIESRFLTATRAGDRRRFAEMAVFVLFSFCGALRGNETLMADLVTLSKTKSEGDPHAGIPAHVFFPLIGRAKARKGQLHHLIPVAAITQLGLRPLLWLDRLMSLLKKEGKTSGPLFQTGTGGKQTLKYFETPILGMLDEIHKDHPNLFPPNIKDPKESYGVSRSFRRGAITEARNQGVDEGDITAQARWRANAQSRSGEAARSLLDLYSDYRLMARVLLKFSIAL